MTCSDALVRTLMNHPGEWPVGCPRQPVRRSEVNPEE